MGVEALAIGAFAGGAATSASSSHKAAKAEEKAARAQAAQSQERAVQVRKITRAKVREIYRSGRELLSEVEAETGKSSLRLSGTPLLVYLDNARRIELTAALAAEEGATESQAWERQADALYRQGRAAGKAGTLGAAASILGGIGRIATM